MTVGDVPPSAADLYPACCDELLIFTFELLSSICRLIVFADDGRRVKSGPPRAISDPGHQRTVLKLERWVDVLKLRCSNRRVILSLIS